ncbi:Flagellar protein [Cupriavidus taiwanensis]|uniref:Flagellar protein n=1 Tax=Cupriavidus taiwanensis TaxID=164546 RepID=A0A976AMA4_9BURK|nr:flagellar protein FlaG [Cupriavidus taiwanensis]SOY93187.1 Flagellar protein [Cupriavidus taiwanensis]SOY96566.1 Flagellar protein [Cupriavidus taiwanensis]SPD68903.1 Flagellar protein [Cupriavidus taiwanensis]
MINTTSPLPAALAATTAVPAQPSELATASAPRVQEAPETGPEAGAAAAPRELAGALTSLSEALRATPLEVRFTIDSETHRVVTTVVDKNSGDTIRQYPSEEMLRITRAIDRLQGLLIHQTA